MASVIDICNIALGQVRGQSINSLTEGSLQSQLCSLHYETVRDQVLKEADWGFSRTVSSLSLLTVTVFNWSYVWSYPNDCLKINNLIRNVEEFTTPTSADSPTRYYPEDHQAYPLQPRVEYSLFNVAGDRVIATREAELRVNYRTRVTDPTLFPPNFVYAVASLLGTHLAVPLAGVKDGRVLRSDCFEMYNGYLAQASDDNANEKQQDQQESEFITIQG